MPTFGLDLPRRHLVSSRGAWGSSGSGAVAAELVSTFPSRPITLIAPWPAGGAIDVTMRILAELAGRQLGQSIVVKNRSGAAGTFVGPALRGATPDGYALGQLPLTLDRFPSQQKVVRDPLRDTVPVIQISGVTFGIAVPAESAFKSLADLASWGRANPQRLTVGSTGIGTTALWRWKKSWRPRASATSMCPAKTRLKLGRVAAAASQT